MHNAKQKRRRGRPTKAFDHQLSSRVMVRLTKADYDYLDGLAQTLGLPKGAVLRKFLINYKRNAEQSL